MHPILSSISGTSGIYGIHEDGFIVAIPCEKAWGFSTKEKSRIAAMIEKERMEARQRRGSYEW